jgi:heat shock protein HspQ
MNSAFIQTGASCGSRLMRAIAKIGEERPGNRGPVQIHPIRGCLPVGPSGNQQISAPSLHRIELPCSISQIRIMENGNIKTAKFSIGQVVRHRLFPFRGIIFDVDPQFANSEEWYQAIPSEVRPSKDQPFYHLLAENSDTEYIAYVSEQNLLEDASGEPVRHPQIRELFLKTPDGHYQPKYQVRH